MYKEIKEVKVKLPILAFCIDGYSSQKIELIIREVIGYPDVHGLDGGYDVICDVLIDAGSYHVEGASCFSTTQILYYLGEELKKCYQNLDGEATYKMVLENNLEFSVVMTGRGHAVIRGTYQERFDIRNILEFEIETDQSFLLPVIQNIEKLKNVFG